MPWITAEDLESLKEAAAAGGQPAAPAPAKRGWQTKSELEATVEEARMKIPQALRPEKEKGWRSRSDLEAKLVEYQGMAHTGSTPPPLPGAAKLVSALDAAAQAPSPAVAARLIETAARQTATELSADRRAPAAPAPAPQPASEFPHLAAWHQLSGADQHAYFVAHKGELNLEHAEARRTGWKPGHAAQPSAAIANPGTQHAAPSYTFGDGMTKRESRDWRPWHSGEPGYPDGPTQAELAKKYPKLAEFNYLPADQRTTFYNQHSAAIREEQQGMQRELDRLPECPTMMEHHRMEPADAAAFMRENASKIASELRAYRAVLEGNCRKMDRRYQQESAAKAKAKVREDHAKQPTHR